MVEQFSAGSFIRLPSEQSDLKNVCPTNQLGLSKKRGVFFIKKERSPGSVKNPAEKTYDKNMLSENAQLKRLSSNRLRTAKGRKRLSIETKNESGIQRLGYELSNLKCRLFDHLQEYEELKDSFPDEQFPPDWEPQAIRNLRGKVDRLKKKIEKEKNKQKMRADDKEVARMVGSLLEHLDDENTCDDCSDPLRNFFMNKVVNDGSLEKAKIVNDTRLIRKIDTLGKKQQVAVLESLKNRQKKLFLAGKSPPRSRSECDSSKAALDCALSRLPPLKKRVKPRKFRRVSSPEDNNRKRENIVVIPNRLRISKGKAFVHERQKEFETFHKKRFNEMDVHFTKTSSECFNHV